MRPTRWNNYDLLTIH